MRSKRDIAINGAIIGAIIVGYIIVTLSTSQPEAQSISFESPGVQTPLKPLKAASSDSTSTESQETINLAQLRGQPFLINFWASWCEACQTEKDELQKLSEAAKGTSVKVIGVASSDKRDAALKSEILKSTTFPQYIDEKGELAQALDIKTLPATLLVDKQGKIISVFKDAITDNQEKLLEKQIVAMNGGVGVYGEIPKFSLVDNYGKEANRETFRNSIWVADFIFTKCPGQCPMMTSKMRELQEQFKHAEGFKLVSVSVDPNNDTPQVLTEYGKKFGADTSRWSFLTGKFGNVKKLIGAGFKLGTPENPELHTSKFVLVDGAGDIRGYYDSSDPASFEKLKADIGRLLKEIPVASR